MNTRDMALLEEAQRSHLNALAGVFGRNLVMEAGVAVPTRSARRLGRRQPERARRPVTRTVSENPVTIKIDAKGNAEVEIEAE